MPLTSKPLSLAALADTVSLPGLTQAIPASTPLSPMIGSISGLSERLAATLLQNAQANPTVTLDKLPQAVVTVALSSRSATIQIDPPELGRIQLDYQFDAQGRTVVTLTPESEAARATLVDRMATITAALEQGSSSGVDVKLGDAQNFGTAFSEASDGDTGEDSSSGSEHGSGERSPSDIDTVLAQRGHHIAEDGTSRLHMRV
jgi:flagellar hook-length control protein FliK